MSKAASIRVQRTPTEKWTFSDSVFCSLEQKLNISDRRNDEFWDAGWSAFVTTAGSCRSAVRGSCLTKLRQFQETHELEDASWGSSHFINCADNDLMITLPPSTVSVSKPAFVR